jgi:2,3-dihydroxyphenylpropionate 1,2-dioxygenase
MIEAFDPELIVYFGTDHFAGFHLSLMPTFCVGIADCEAVDDIGGAPGPLNVAGDSARELVEHVRAENFDPAVSYKMRVDHAFSQPLHRLFGRNDRYPVIPIFISVLTQPFNSFRRSRLFGQAVGNFIAQSGKRILIMGTGGLSHHPTRYYPLPEDAEPSVYAYQLDGDRGGNFDDASWFERLRRMHLEGAEMLISGARTRKDIRLNPEMDRRFLELFAADQLEAMDDWGRPETVEQAGIGFMEVHAWIAAGGAKRSSGETTALTTVYAPALEYGVGYGMAYSRN